MSEAVVYLQPALILQHRPYRETSLLLEVFTQDFGIISILAKGVRKEKSKMAGLLLPFSLLNISYLDRSELKTLIQAEYLGSYALQRLALYCGFYVNELVQKFLHKHDPHPELFVRYQRCLRDLSRTDAIEQTLRYFELDLLTESGYGGQLDVDGNTGDTVQDRRRYNFSPGLGMVADIDGLVSGETLCVLAAQGALDRTALFEAKLLLRKMLDVHLKGRPLKSRDVLAKIIKYL
jgi:DNA repair protein RecO (recombination protein O)